ncbi:MAG: hypothetical protein Q8K37_01265, partial [Alphaproteobacteria bacterium]|nr:hypothetical protein [Alphaproteobacteria bacterium]
DKMQSLEKSLAASIKSISHIKPIIEKSLDVLSLNPSEKIDVMMKHKNEKLKKHSSIIWKIFYLN